MRKNYFIIPYIFVFAIMSISCNRHKPTDSATSGKLLVMCDENISDIIQQEEDAFEFTYPEAAIDTKYVSSEAAIDSLLSLNSSLVISTSPLSDEQKKLLNDKNCVPYSQIIATDAITFIVNKDNTMEELSISDLKDVVSGSVTEWGKVEPSKLSDIHIVALSAGSPIMKYLSDSLLRDKDLAKGINTLSSYAEVVKAVESDKNAIGIVGASAVLQRPELYKANVETRVESLQKSDTTALDFIPAVKVLKIRKDNEIDSYKPYQANVYNGLYPLYISYYASSSSPMGSLSRGYLAFLTGFLGQKILQTCGMLPGSMQPRMINDNK